jgi:hypothetical protein
MLDVGNQDVEYQNQPAADKKKIIAMPRKFETVSLLLVHLARWIAKSSLNPTASGVYSMNPGNPGYYLVGGASTSWRIHHEDDEMDSTRGPACSRQPFRWSDNL